MGHGNGKITGPVNTDDVRAVLGDNSDDIGTLCTSKKINPAALFRPRYSPNNPGLYLCDSNGKFSTAANAEIANNQPPAGGSWQCPACGIWVPEFVLGNLTAGSYGNMQGIANKTWFVPIPDKDGTASFKILDHFIGYDRNAKFKDPVNHVEVNQKNSTTNTITLQLKTSSPADEPGTISVGNMFGGKGWYFGAVVFRGTNPEGITQNDTMIIFGSSVAIKADQSTTVTINKDDTPPDASSTTYYYWIIPFVCNKANVTAALDTTFYSIHMSDEYPGIYRLKSGESATGGGVKDYTFLWSEPSNISLSSGTQGYPIVGGKEVPITPSTYHPGIVATFKARPDGMGTAPLKDLYSRVDFNFSFYVNGVLNLITYIWRKTGALPGDNVLKRDTSKDNTGGFEDYLFFSVEDGASAIINKVSDPSTIELTADFYYADSTQVDDGLWGTWIPDND